MTTTTAQPGGLNLGGGITIGNALTPDQIAAQNANNTPNLPGYTPGAPTLTNGVNGTNATNASTYNIGTGETGNSSPSRTLYSPDTGTNLGNSLESSFEGSQPYQSILSSYNNATGATAGQYSAAGSQIATEYGQNAAYQGQENRIALDQTMTGRSLATNTALLADQQDQADQRIKNINDQMNAALAANNTSAASALADLAVKEQSTITDARTSFLNTYFQSQAEARSEASFQTPEQQAALKLAGQYPDAGITAQDTLAQAQAKVQNSKLYQAGITATKAGAAASLGAAAASSAAALASKASATQTQAITDLMSGTNSAAGEAYFAHQLALNQQDPTTGMTLDQVQSQISSNLPGGASYGVMTAIQQQATSAGWSGAGSAIGNTKTLANAQSIGGGGLGGAMTGATNFLGNYANSTFGSNPFSTTGSTPSTNSTPSLSNLTNPTNGSTYTGPDPSGNMTGNFLWLFQNGQWVAIGNAQ